MKRTIILIFLFVAFLLVLLTIFQTSKNSGNAMPQKFWQIEAVDTVKYSRDPSRDPNIYAHIPTLVEEAAKLHTTHIAINTPYDEEFYPVLRAWVDEARRNKLKVWFRGNFSGWEGWFGYQKFESVDEHNKLTATFVAKHPDLFEDGDIFTPLPEPENGGPGDPRGSDQKTTDFNAMLISSYNNCQQAFEKINKQVSCGFFSTNGDIAKDILTPDTVAKIGNIIVIDHYVDSPTAMQEELDTLIQKFPNAKIMLGEFGAPIPDINGTMTEDAQNTFVTSLLDVFYTYRKHILGLNYWTLAGGSTQLLNDDTTERKVFTTLSNYYLPSQLTGKVTDTLGNSLRGIQILGEDGAVVATTNNNGAFSIAVQKNAIVPLVIQESGYKSFTQKVIVTQNHQNLQNVELQPTNPDIFYKVNLFFKRIFPF